LPGATGTGARDAGTAERADTPRRAGAVDAAAPLPAPLLAQLLPVAEAVESGDLLALASGTAPGLAKSAVARDPLVVGIAVGDPGQLWRGTAPVALAGTVVSCRADATGAPIAAGDLLASSSLPGHAMKAPEGAAPGTIVAKALEPLAAGTGPIRVLVMAR
jgi:hypothetical protein